MDVLLFDVIKYLLLRKTDVLKTCQKSKLLGKKIWRNALALNVDFRDIMNVSPNILASKKWNFKNWDMVLQMKEHRLATTLISSVTGKTLYLFACKKILSVALNISWTVYHMIVTYDTHVQNGNISRHIFIFSKFWFFGC